jgi:threonine aldolase
MANQVALKANTQPLDEIICEENSHIFQYELGGYGLLSGAAILPLHSESTKLTAEMVSRSIRPEADWLPNSKLVVIENTGNRTGGNYYAHKELRPIREVCDKAGMKMHLDGARIFNALVETKESTRDTGALFDSISFCLSKGLGAPIGSMLLGKSEFIHRARKIRKALGGGMRQVGFLAAAGIYALDFHIDRLKEDHHHAQQISNVLYQCSYVASIKPVHTNIIIFDLKEKMTGAAFADLLRKKNITISIFGPQTIRMVTHLDITPDMVSKVCNVLLEINKSY